MVGAVLPSQFALDDARFDEPAVAPCVESEVDAHRMPSARHAVGRRKRDAKGRQLSWLESLARGACTHTFDRICLFAGGGAPSPPPGGSFTKGHGSLTAVFLPRPPN